MARLEHASSIILCSTRNFSLLKLLMDKVMVYLPVGLRDCPELAAAPAGGRPSGEASSPPGPEPS